MVDVISVSHSSACSLRDSWCGSHGPGRLREPVYLKSTMATYGRTYEQRPRDRVNYERANPIHVNNSAG